MRLGSAVLAVAASVWFVQRALPSTRLFGHASSGHALVCPSRACRGRARHDAHGRLPGFCQGGHAQAPVDLIERGYRALFDDQQYEESIQTLSAALVRPNNTKGQKLDIYRLLALNYITLNRKDEAESAVRGLLALQPEYMLPSGESPRFRDFFAAAKQRWEAEGRPGLVREASSLPAAVTMTHNSPAQAEKRKQLDLTAILSDPDHRVVTVKLFYRHGSKAKFDDTSADLDGEHVRASIPPEAVLPRHPRVLPTGVRPTRDPHRIAWRCRSAAAGSRLRPDSGVGAPRGHLGGVVVVALGIIGGVLLFGRRALPRPPSRRRPPR